MKYKYAVIDLETTGTNRFKHVINYAGVGLAKDKDSPLDKRLIYNMHIPEDKERFLKTVDRLKREGIICIWQNGKFDTLFIWVHFKQLLPIHHDIMLMGTAYDLASKHGLKDMAVTYLGCSDWDIPLREKIKPNSPIVEKYLLEDLSKPWELFQFFCKKLNAQQWKVYNELLLPAFLMYRKAENKGIYYDAVKAVDVKKKYTSEQKRLHKVLADQYDINWNSNDQVRTVLFDKEGMPPQKLSPKGKPSTDAKVLKKLAAKGFVLPQQLLDYKFYFGANSKFLNNWGDYAAYDGRIHPSFNLTNVVTGRTSCSEPNLQQVPRNPELRSLFTAKKGRTLIEADYSQLELRIAADYANESTMIRIYKDEGDIHTETAMAVSGKSNPDKEDRSRAKPVNFGFLYGMSAKGFVNYAFDGYGVLFSYSEAKAYRELFFAKYAGLEAWHKETAIICEMQGGIANSFGRFRKLPNIYSQDDYLKSQAIRQAINSPVQGTGSDLLLFSAVQIQKELGKEFNLQIVGTIHDSILIDVPEIVSKEASKEVKRIMENPAALKSFGVKFKVPLVADIGFGAWGSK